MQNRNDFPLFATGKLARIFLWLTAVFSSGVLACHAASGSLVWDALEKDAWPKVGDATAEYTFSVTNESDAIATVTSVQTSCGCTVAKIPSQPWPIAGHSNGDMTISVNLAGKSGTVVKTITVNQDGQAPQILTVVVHMPDSPEARRMREVEMSKLDRQAPFKGDCASCHAVKLEGKMGKELYLASCAVCHESTTPANVVAGAKMIPDLKNLNHPTDYDFWKMTITVGKPGTMMPAWSQAAGGPLTDAQIDSLAKTLVAMYPSHGTNASTAGIPLPTPQLIRVTN